MRLVRRGDAKLGLGYDLDAKRGQQAAEFA
jgi:hypothetical protein